MESDFLAPRVRLRDPIPEIFLAAHLLDRAVGAHLCGDHMAAQSLIQQANTAAVRKWTESLWGNRRDNPEQEKFIRKRKVATAPPNFAKANRSKLRDPSAATKRAMVEKYGYNCVFCGIPVIREEIRKALNSTYPEIKIWGAGNINQHAALQCMWLQYDHVLPHARGGDSLIENMVVTCAPCNYGRGDFTLEEVGLIDPRTRPIHKTSWDGLERFLSAKKL